MNNSAMGKNGKQKPNPWRGRSMFQPTPPPSRVNFRFNRKPRNKVTVTPIEMAQNFINTVKDMKVITNTNQPKNIREVKVKNTYNRAVKQFRAYMNSEGPSSGASQLFVKETLSRTPPELKILVSAIMLSAGYCAMKYRRFIIPFIFAMLLKKSVRK